MPNKEDLTRQSLARETAVVPLDKISPEDVSAGRRAIDAWLRGISGGHVTVERVTAVAGALPIVGNTMAAVDAVCDLIAIVRLRAQGKAVSAFEWASFAINLIGVIPVPPATAAARMSLRPALHLARDKLRHAGADLGEAVVVLLADHLNATLAGELDTFVKGATARLPQILEECAGFAQNLSGGLASALRRLATGQVFDAAVAAQPLRHDPESRSPGIWASVAGAVVRARDSAVAGARRTANAAAGLAMRHAPGASELAQALQAWASQLDALGAEARQKIVALGDAAAPMSIGWLLQRLEQAALRVVSKGRTGMVNVNTRTTARHDRQRAEGQLGASNNQLTGSVGEANRCKNCPAATATPRAINFATGSETVEHVDFSLPGHMPIVWRRTYHSRLGAYDLPTCQVDGAGRAPLPAYLGARWSSPYTSRIEQAPDGSLRYFAADGRTHDFPALAGPAHDPQGQSRPSSQPGQPGQTHHDPVEDLTLGRGTEALLILAHGNDFVERFELAPAFWREGKPYTLRRGVHYRLVSQRTRSGHTTELHYRHPGGQLSDIVSGETHVATELDAQGRIQALWLVEQEARVRQLAAYTYEALDDGSSDLVAARDENGDSRAYAYLAAAAPGAAGAVAAAGKASTHLLSRYTERTGRAVHLQWMHEDGFDKPLTAAHARQARAWHERADDGSFETTLVWNRHIRMVTVTDALGAQTRHYFDLQGYTYRVVHPQVEAEDGKRYAHEEWFFRDARQNIVRHLHPDGSQERFAYDARGNLVTHVRADQSAVHFAYDAKDNLTGILDAEGHAWRRDYDGRNLVEETDPLGHKTRYAYDANGLPVEVTDAHGGKKKLQYDASGQLVAYTDCSGKTSRWAYDPRGRLVAATSAAGETTRYHYDEEEEGQGQGQGESEKGRRTRIVHPDGSQEHLMHDAEGRLLAHRDALQRETHYTYGASGLLAQRRDANGHTIDYRWDRAGRLVALRNENQQSHAFSYDPVGRLLSEVHFDGLRTEYVYASETGVLDKVREADALTQVVFDALGRLTGRAAVLYVRPVDGRGRPGERTQDRQTLREERFAYDGNGRLVDARNAHIQLQWHYDAVGNVQAEHHHYRFDARGRPSQQALTAVWRHSHDALGNRVQTIRPDGHRTTWLSYGSGHVHGLMLDEAEALQIERDDAHREVLRTQGNGVAEERRYDPAGRLAAQVLRRVDRLGKVAGMQGMTASEPTTSSLSYSPSSSPSSSPFHLRRSYTYDRAGALTDIADSRRGALGYRYDPVGRLLRASSRLGEETFAFDPAGNILDPEGGPARQWRPSYLESELSSRTPAILDNLIREYAGTHYDYNGRAQVVRRLRNGKALRFKWDAFGRLSEAYTREVRTVFAYDPLGRRILKRGEPTLMNTTFFEGTQAFRNEYWRQMRERGLGATFYGWEGDCIAWESDSRGGGTLHYVFEPQGFTPVLQARASRPMMEVLLARPAEVVRSYANEAGEYELERDPLYNGAYEPGYDADGNPPEPLTQIHYYQCDHLGTPMELTDEAGEIAWEAQYKAWGEAQVVLSEAARRAGVKNPLRFQGQYFDEETGLHYNRYRYYDPHAGRFFSKDPIGLAGGINLQAYAPNPVEFIDPLGLRKYVIIGEGQASVEAYAAAMRTANRCHEFKTIASDWVSITRDIPDKFGTKGWEQQAVARNAKWVRSMASDGYEFIDIGTDGAANRSPFYEAEKKALSRVGAKIYRSNRCATEAARSTAKESTRPIAKGRYGAR